LIAGVWHTVPPSSRSSSPTLLQEWQVQMSQKRSLDAATVGSGPAKKKAANTGGYKKANTKGYNFLGGLEGAKDAVVKCLKRNPHMAFALARWLESGKFEEMCRKAGAQEEGSRDERLKLNVGWEGTMQMSKQVKEDIRHHTHNHFCSPMMQQHFKTHTGQLNLAFNLVFWLSDVTRLPENWHGDDYIHWKKTSGRPGLRSLECCHCLLRNTPRMTCRTCPCWTPRAPLMS